MSRPDHEAALVRANRIIGWMAEYLGRMATPDNGIADLNEHWLYMQRNFPRKVWLTKRPKTAPALDERHSLGGKPE